MNKLSEMKKELLALKSEAQELLDNGKVHETEELIDKMKDFKNEILKQEIKEAEEMDELKKKISNKESDKTDMGLLRNALSKGESMLKNSLCDEQANLNLGKYIKGMVTGDWKFAENESNAYKSLHTGTGTVLIPEVLSGNIIDLARNQMALDGILTIPMSTNNLTIAKIAQDPEFKFKLEGDTAESSNMTFGSIELKSKTIYGLMEITEELLNSSNCESIVTQAMAKATAQALDRAGLYGQGIIYDTDGTTIKINEPKGITTYDSINRLDAQDRVSTGHYKSFINAIGKIKESNKAPTTVVYNSSLETELNLLTNTVGDPLQAPGAFNSLERKVSNNIANDTALVFDRNAIVMGIQKNIAIDTTKNFYNGTLLLRVMAFIDFALLDDKAVTLINYKAK